MTSRRAKNGSVSSARPPRSRSKIASVDVKDGSEPRTVVEEEASPADFPAMKVVYRRWAEPPHPRPNLKIYLAGDDASRGLQYRACLRRAHVVAWGVPTPTVFEDRTKSFSELEALVREVLPGTTVIFSTIARRAAGDRIEAMKLALADRPVKFIEVPEWYRGLAELRRAPWKPGKSLRTTRVEITGRSDENGRGRRPLGIADNGRTGKRRSSPSARRPKKP